MRSILTDVLLVDMELVEHILLDWRVWETRQSSWQLVWQSLCQSTCKENKYRPANCEAVLESEIVQKAVRIPQVKNLVMKSHTTGKNIAL